MLGWLIHVRLKVFHEYHFRNSKIHLMLHIFWISSPKPQSGNKWGTGFLKSQHQRNYAKIYIILYGSGGSRTSKLGNFANRYQIINSKVKIFAAVYWLKLSELKKIVIFGAQCIQEMINFNSEIITRFREGNPIHYK